MSSFKEMLGLELFKFAGANNLKKVQACIELDVDVNTFVRGSTAAHVAAILEHIQVLRLLAATGSVDWNKRDYIGCTPLHLALRNGQYEAAAVILQQDGIDFSLRAACGDTVASSAVHGQSVPCVEILAQQESCDCWNIPDHNGDTPIMVATHFYGNPDILKILLKCPRVDPNIKDRTGNTPVMKAIKEGKVALAKILIKSPRVDLTDGNGSSLLQIARVKGLPELIDLICDAMEAKIGKLQEENSDLKEKAAQLIPECPVCFEQFRKDQPVFSCVAGHHLCGSCKAKKTIKRCPECRRPYGEDIRAHDFEKLIGDLWG